MQDNYNWKGMEITRRHIPVSRNVHLYNKITDHLAIFKNKKT